MEQPNHGRREYRQGHQDQQRHDLRDGPDPLVDRLDDGADGDAACARKDVSSGTARADHEERC
jgi:hypothetical protein